MARWKHRCELYNVSVSGLAQYSDVTQKWRHRHSFWGKGIIFGASLLDSRDSDECEQHVCCWESQLRSEWWCQSATTLRATVDAFSFIVFARRRQYTLSRVNRRLNSIVTQVVAQTYIAVYSTVVFACWVKACKLKCRFTVFTHTLRQALIRLGCCCDRDVIISAVQFPTEIMTERQVQLGWTRPVCWLWIGTFPAKCRL